MPLPFAEVWYSRDPTHWAAALERYWSLLRPELVELEHRMDPLDHERIRALDPVGWHQFLRNEYFRWKYTAPNRYATTTAALDRSSVQKPGGLAALFTLKDRLLSLETNDIAGALLLAQRVPGLGTAGASGLLALLYPHAFGTVDQFVVKALRLVPRLPEASLLIAMNPEGLTPDDGIILIRIMRRQAAVLATAFASTEWTPRAVDKVLWTYGR